jgi:hypothetical protein
VFHYNHCHVNAGKGFWTLWQWFTKKVASTKVMHETMKVVLVKLRLLQIWTTKWWNYLYMYLPCEVHKNKSLNLIIASFIFNETELFHCYIYWHDCWWLKLNGDKEIQNAHDKALIMIDHSGLRLLAKPDYMHCAVV